MSDHGTDDARNIPVVEVLLKPARHKLEALGRKPNRLGRRLRKSLGVGRTAHAMSMNIGKNRPSDIPSPPLLQYIVTL